jgi:hypothetical protein
MKTASFWTLFLALTVIFTGSATASGATYLADWTFGGASEDLSYSIALDNDGNVYVAGSFTGTVDFGGGDRTAAGGEDIFIVKFDSDGNYVWDYTPGGDSDGDIAYGIDTDSYGNVYACGSFSSSVDFGGGLRAATGGLDIFVLKLNPDGNWLWDRTFGNRNNQAGVALVVDGDNNVITTGRNRNPINFGGGVRPPAGMRDIFVLKLDTDGLYVWDRMFGGEGRDAGRQVIVDGDDNIYIVGNFEYTVDFGGGDRTEGNTAFYDAYLLKLDSGGNYVNDKTWGGSGEDANWGIALDSDGNVYVTGYYEGTVDLGGGDRTSNGSWDVCTIKFDGGFNYLWDYTCGGAGDDFGYDITMIGDDHIFIFGTFGNTVDFGGGDRTSAGGQDVFILENDSGGGYLWDDTHGGIERERSQGIALNPSEGMYVLGYFGDTVNFGGVDRTSSGSFDVFVVKYEVPIPATVDIDPNTLNLKSRGRWITCYMELMEGFDVADIDVASVRLNDIVPAETEPTGIGDYDDDGCPDLMVKFARPDVIALLSPGEAVPVTVTGYVGDDPFSGTDYIRIISPPVLPPVDEETTPPVETVSLKAHPNPFNPSVQIVYSVPKSSRVLIQVWDITGRLIRTIEDTDRAEGVYKTEWNGINEVGRAVTSGVYFCRLSVGGDVITRKLMLLR